LSNEKSKENLRCGKFLSGEVSRKNTKWFCEFGKITKILIRRFGKGSEVNF
jgi:hypothetical protein